VVEQSQDSGEVKSAEVGEQATESVLFAPQDASDRSELLASILTGVADRQKSNKVDDVSFRDLVC
jgi:hypothetical protein